MVPFILWCTCAAMCIALPKVTHAPILWQHIATQGIVHILLQCNSIQLGCESEWLVLAPHFKSWKQTFSIFGISYKQTYTLQTDEEEDRRRWTACSRLEPTRELSLPIMYRRRYSMACLSDKNRHFRTHMVTITDSMASSFYFLQETQLSRISKTSVYHGNKTHVLQYNAKISV